MIDCKQLKIIVRTNGGLFEGDPLQVLPIVQEWEDEVLDITIQPNYFASVSEHRDILTILAKEYNQPVCKFKFYYQPMGVVDG